MVILAEKPVVGIHQLALAHGGGGLLQAGLGGALLEAQLAHAHAHGAGGNHDDLDPGVLDIADHLAEALNMPDIEVAGGIGKGGGSYFYYDSHLVCSLFS